MTDGLKKLLSMALLACLVGGLPLGGERAAAQEPSVLKTVRGLASDNLTVLINHAVVVESAQPFIEVSVANPAIADVSPLSDRTIYIFGKERGGTTLTLLGENGTLITNVSVMVIPDLAEMKTRLKQMLPNEPIDVRLSGGGVVLSGVVSGKAKIDRAMTLAQSYVGNAAINMMTVGGTQQVMMKVRIAEMSRSAAKSLGIDFGITGDGSSVGGFFGSGNNTTAAVTNDAGAIGKVLTDGGVVPLGLSTATSAFGGIGLLAELGDIGISFVMSALEEKGFSRTLAEPNLVALSGSEARFLAGEDVPIPTIDQDGNVDITFKEVGVGLTFQPSVLDDDLIQLALAAEVSAVNEAPGQPISFTASDVTTFTTRRAITTVQLRDGQSFAIAGLIKDDFSDSVTQFPWLGDIPVLGTLFRSMDYARGETELVIIVTAHLVTPVDGSELSVPSDHIRIPNEFELFLLGNTEGAGAPGMVQSQGFDGDFGYVVE